MGERYNYNWNVGHCGPGVSKNTCNSTCPIKSVIDNSTPLYFTLFYSMLLHFYSLHARLFLT